jgi:serine/threonine protein phosphatase PrpC
MWPKKKPKETSLTINLNSATDVGKKRNHNEDAYLALGVEESPLGASAVLLVADGMGGHAAGDVASGMTKERTYLLLLAEEKEFMESSDPSFATLLGGVLRQVNREVYKAAKEPGQNGMGTTCTLAVIKKAKLFLAHIGDSRAYLFREGNLHQITTDHSWVEEEVVAGRLSRERARVHPRRNIITKAIGIEPEAEIDQTVVGLEMGDLILVASDGLTSLVPDNEIENILKTENFGKTCEKLISAANNYGGDDNITVVIALVEQDNKPNNQPPSQSSKEKTLEMSRGFGTGKSLLRKFFRRK